MITKGNDKIIFKRVVCLPLITLSLYGCAAFDSGPMIKAGDTVGIHFTCRLPNAAVAISSEKDVTADPGQPKASFFLPRVGDETLKVVAGVGEADQDRPIKGFEDDVLQGIAVALPGLRAGESRTLDLLSSAGSNGELRLAHVRQTEKERQVSVDEFKEHTQRAPEQGQTVQFGDGLPGVVKEIRDGKVTITFSAPDGTTVNTPLGPGKVRDAGNVYDIVIDAKQGDLMRVGPLVGRVKYVDDRNIDLDFTRTFGGENLRCDVRVESVKPGVELASNASNHVGSVAQGEASPAQPQKTGASPPDTQQGSALLQKAVADALKGGKTSVSLDLDAVMNGAAKGDLVTVRFTVRDPGGASLSLPEPMAKQDTPQEIIAGKDEIFPGLGDAVVNMAPGEKKQITIPPEKAFGPRNESNIVTYQRKTTYPVTMILPADEYVKRYGGFPAVGKEVPLAPFITTKVARIGEKEVTLAITAQDGARFDRPIGIVTVSVAKEGITLHLEPKLGAPFSANNRQGVISAINGETFTVDFNHPLAGKTIKLDLEVVSVTKAANLQAAHIGWIENHDAGLAKAKKEGKPLFVLLYADWCHWCKRTQAESLTDPRIGKLMDKFVWMKLNSDKERKYKQEFGQDGFPMMVILRPDGTVAEKIDGFRDGATLSGILSNFLASSKPGEAKGKIISATDVHR